MTHVATLALSQASVVITWAVVGLVLAGIGLAFRRLFGALAIDLDELAIAFWAGYAIALFLLQLWHLLFPVNAGALLVLLALGVAGLLQSWRGIGSWLGTDPWRGRGWAIAGALALLLFASNRAIGPVENYDTGMYHLPVVNWAKSFAVVPGLVNLHGRLAFNSSSLLFAAALDQGPWTGRAAHIANSLLVAWFLVRVATAWTRVLSGTKRPGAWDVFDAMLLLPLAAILISGDLSSLETDTPTSLLLLVSASRILRALSLPTAQRAGNDFATVALLLSASMCVKLSAVVIAGMLILVAAWTFRSAFGSWSDAVLRVLPAPVLLVLLWMSRGVILSGYPMYPAGVFGFPVPWRAPAEQAFAEAAWIRMSAHELNHNRIVAGFDWLLPWAKEIATDIRWMFLVPAPAILAVLLALLLLVRRRALRDPYPRLALVASAVIGLIFWFVAAPHPRFGMAPMWLATGVLATLALDTVGDAQWPRAVRLAAVSGLAASTVAVAGLLATGRLGGPNRRSDAHPIAGVFFPPGPDHGFYPVAMARLASYTTTSGLRLVVPRDNNLCWNGPLLCTPHPEPNLRLRVAGTLAGGFVADGGTWQPVRWPNPWTPFRPWLACRDTSTIASRLDRDRACIVATAKARTDTLDRASLSPPPSR